MPTIKIHVIGRSNDDTVEVTDDKNYSIQELQKQINYRGLIWWYKDTFLQEGDICPILDEKEKIYVVADILEKRISLNYNQNNNTAVQEQRKEREDGMDLLDMDTNYEEKKKIFRNTVAIDLQDSLI
ncbi:10800_t:CDS:2 [Ambispora gerdemannii]|uniref:10800_t:CDS:1 n=1 Tax=Ambispora gerdemannii TaxID=144530 RepID=A0A9N8WJS7_9GLOM|nr:10800_t:CDS:2 [Ambispora gerdemannii]